MKDTIAVIAGWLSAEGGGAARSSRLQADIYERLGFAPTLLGLSSRPPGDDGAGRSAGDGIIYTEPYAPDAADCLVGRVEDRIGGMTFAHLQGPDVMLMARCAELCTRRGVAYIYTPRGAQAILQRADQSKAAKAARRASRDLVRAAAAVTMTSRMEGRDYGGALHGTRAFYIPNAVDLASFAPANERTRAQARRELAIPEHCHAVIHYGRIAPEKNLSFLLDVIAAAPSGPTRLFLVGPETPGYADALRGEIAARGLFGQVVLAGEAIGIDRRRWLAAADMVLIPSRSENFCLSLVEAAAMGTALLVSPHIGALEYGGMDHVRVCPLDVGLWAAALRTAPYLSAAARRRTYTRLADRFSVDAVARDWREALAELGWLHRAEAHR